MSDLQNMFSVNFTALTNDRTYYTRVYPMNPKGFAQSEIETQVGSAVPMAGLNLSELPEGSVVMINESGVPAPFYVAKHDYESGLNGAGRTLLVRKDTATTMGMYSTSTNKISAYAQSDADKWLNETYKATLGAKIQTAMGETKFPYIVDGVDMELSELSRSVFLLSIKELDKTVTGNPPDGSALPVANTLRPSNTNYYTRTPVPNSSNFFFWMTAAGERKSTDGMHNARGIRPVFTLPATTKFNAEPNADGSYTLL